MSNTPPEIDRVDKLWRVLNSNDKLWVDVKSDEGSFYHYLYYEGDYSEVAYMIYADGRQMAFNLSGWLGLIHLTDECPSYSAYVKHLEEVVRVQLPEYEKIYQMHQDFVEHRCNVVGAPRVWEVDLALRLWKEQMGILRSLPAVIGLFKHSDLYKAENNIMPMQNAPQHININTRDGSTINASIVSGNENRVDQCAKTSITLGAKEELFSRLRDAGVTDDWIERLDTAIIEDSQDESTDDPTIGQRVKTWLGDLALAAAQQSLELANGVTSSLVASWIQMYYGSRI